MTQNAQIDTTLPDRPAIPARKPDPCVLVIFGATGDLAARKLIPALYHLAKNSSLPENFAVVGVSRSVSDADAFRASLLESTRKFSRTKGVDEAVWADFGPRIFTVAGGGGNPDTYRNLRETMDAIDGTHGTARNRLYYLAVAPSLFPSILQQLKNAGLIYPAADHSAWSRVVIEKPLGADLPSSKLLNSLIAEVLDESQTYRIDHYLGKETVQNILVFRFANSLFEPLWNQKYIDHVQVTVAEDLEVKNRGEFYDQIGVTRDIIQNHLLQILALVAMEPPGTLGANCIRDEKVKVIRSLRPIAVEEDVVVGQYQGYQEVSGVSPGSRTPTFLAARLMIDNWRWSGVPFYIRAGKGMSAKDTEVAIFFKSVPSVLFGRNTDLAPNCLILQIQPDEGISLRFSCKVPGDDLAIGDVSMDFAYNQGFHKQPGDAYERLLLDAMRGDATLFARRDEVEEAWKWLDPFNAWWENGQTPMPTYPLGQDGPEESQAIVARDAHLWRKLG